MSENLLDEAESEASKLFHETETFFSGLVSKFPHLSNTVQPVATAASDIVTKVETAVPVMVDDAVKYVEGMLPTGSLATLGDSIIDKIVAALQGKKTTATPAA